MSEDHIFFFFKVASNTPDSMRRVVMIKSHFHWAGDWWTPTGRSTVRGACQPANSHHQRNYIHKHSLLSCRAPSPDPLLTLILQHLLQIFLLLY